MVVVVVVVVVAEELRVKPSLMLLRSSCGLYPQKLCMCHKGPRYVGQATSHGAAALPRGRMPVQV